MIPPRIFLTGFMGCGKSTVGPLLAERLGYGFADLDERVEAVAGQSALTLFTARGEALFRALETAVLTQTLAEEHLVVATGGGALVSEANLALAQDGGAVVYLRVPVETLVRRLTASTDRPLLHGADGEPLAGAALHDRIAALLERRRAFYERADVVVDAGSLAPPALADVVQQCLAAA